MRPGPPCAGTYRRRSRAGRPARHGRARATPNTAAALTGLIFDRAEKPPEDIDGDVSTRISDRPRSAGTLDRLVCSARSSAWPQRRLGACSYAARNRYGSCRERATSSGSASRAATRAATLSRTPASSKPRRLRSSAMYPIDGISASHSSALGSAGPARESTSSHVMPARLRASASSSRRGSPAAAARRAALAATIGSASGSTDHGRSCRRSSACTNSAPCHGAAGDGCTRSTTSANRKAWLAVSYLSRLRSVYSRVTAWATPRLTGLGRARPCVPVQYASASPGSSARWRTEATTWRAPGMPASTRARAEEWGRKDSNLEVTERLRTGEVRCCCAVFHCGVSLRPVIPTVGGDCAPGQRIYGRAGFDHGRFDVLVRWGRP